MTYQFQLAFKQKIANVEFKVRDESKGFVIVIFCKGLHVPAML